MKKFIHKIILRIRGTLGIEELKLRGLRCGKNFSMNYGCVIDESFCHLIEIGDNVTLAPRVYILAHDASTKNYLGYTKIGAVKIEDNVFIGAGSIILPGVHIGRNVIIGAGSVVTKDILENTVVGGNPAREIKKLDVYISKEKENMKRLPIFSEEYTSWNCGKKAKFVSKEKKEEMKLKLSKNEGKGFVI